MKESRTGHFWPYYSPAAQTPVTLVSEAEDAQAPWMAMTLVSALRRIDPDRAAQVFVIDRGMSSGILARVLSCMLRAHPRVRVAFLAPGAEAPARLALVSLLPDGLSRALWLEAGLVAGGDVSPLFDMDMAGQAVWAAPEAQGPSEGARAADRFNADVLLFNLAELRGRFVADLPRADLSAGRGRASEQDALNIAFQGKWGALPERWNNQIMGSGRLPAAPGILNFAGPAKPWAAGSHRAGESEYLDAALASGWYGPMDRLRISLRRARLGLRSRLPRAALAAVG